ncbi:hypothetical protein ACHAXT_005170 [Thalassiosira profunda]
MPIPPIIPLPPHLLLPGGPAAAAAATRAAGAGASSLLAAALARNLWEQTPEWVRNDESWKAFSRAKGAMEAEAGDEDFVDEMATLTAVIRKLELLVITGYDKLGSERRMGRRRHVVRRTVSRHKLSGESSERSGESENSDLQQRQHQPRPSLRLEEDDSNTQISPLEWHAALLAYWQLCNQMRERHPWIRDSMYKQDTGDEDRDSVGRQRSGEDINESDNLQEGDAELQSNGPEISDANDPSIRPQHISTNDDSKPKQSANQIMTSAEIKKLRQMLDYAVFAYEPNEELLRSLLLTGKGATSWGEKKSATDAKASEELGYQLIVHRTTSYIDPNEQADKDSNGSGKRTSSSKRKPPGRVGYFVAISQAKKKMLVGIKGTSTLEDLITDCCGRAVRVDLENDPHHPALDNEKDIASEESAESEESMQIDENGAESAVSPDSDSDEDLVDAIRFSRTNGACLSESVEVELMSDDMRSSESPNDIASAQQKEARKSTTRPTVKTTAPAMHKVPSDNVLLFQSRSKSSGGKSQSQSTNKEGTSSHPCLMPSPTDEYMESNGIEMEENRSHKLRGAHEGILHCAQQLLFEIAPLIEEYAVSKGFSMICTGHSLGAGTAALLAVLVRGRYPELAVPNQCNTSDDSEMSRERVCAYAFAPPPTLDRASSLACSHYIVSVANNSDIIPRSSLCNLDVFLTVLEAVRSRLVEVGMNPGGSARSSDGPRRNAIASTLALFRKLSEGTKGDLLLDPSELQCVWKEAVSEASLGDGEADTTYWDAEFGHHLFVPGKLLMMHESWSNTVSEKVDGDDPAHLPASENEQDDRNSNTSPAFHAMWTNGTNTALKGFEVGAGAGMATDHLTTSYERGLALLQDSLQ